VCSDESIGSVLHRGAIADIQTIGNPGGATFAEQRGGGVAAPGGEAKDPAARRVVLS
jgi:hypothetical protein